MIDGVKVRRLKRHLDERGYVMEILRDDDPEFIKFGQIYITTCSPGIVKAWHCHEKQFDTFCVIKGTVKIGLYDDRPESPTRGQTGTVIMSELEPVLVQIPPRGLARPDVPRGRDLLSHQSPDRALQPRDAGRVEKGPL